MNNAIAISVLCAVVLIPFLLVVFVRIRRLPWALSALGIAVWAGYAIYALQFYECPEHDGECEPGLGVFYLAILLVLWLGGIGAGSAGAWMRRRLSAAAPRRRRL
jgi:hypothetical protein